jgi:hypothetical protein
MTGWFQEAEHDGHNITEARADDLLIWTDDSDEAVHIAAGGPNALASFSASNGVRLAGPTTVADVLSIQALDPHTAVLTAVTGDLRLEASSNCDMRLSQQGLTLVGPGLQLRASLSDDTPAVRMNSDDGTITTLGGLAVSSDRRLKTNVRPLDGALSKVMRLQGYTFDRLLPSGQTRRGLGLLAQEVREVLPDAVMEDPVSGYLSVRYPEMCGLLVEAIKELAAKP